MGGGGGREWGKDGKRREGMNEGRTEIGGKEEETKKRENGEQKYTLDPSPLVRNFVSLREKKERERKKEYR